MKRFAFLRSADVVTLAFVSALIVVEMIYYPVIERANSFILMNAVFCTAIFFSARYTARAKNGNYAVIFFRDWYLYGGILFIYMQASTIAYPIHGRDFDETLIMFDRMIFGGDPTHWIHRFAHPVITEILQIAYSSYYLYYIALFTELYRRGDRTEFQSGGMLVVYAFYLSYIGYLLVPAIGPRFTLHDFSMTDVELPGLFLTKYLRMFINSGGGVPENGLNPVLYVNRDTFPSGHTELTLMAMYLAFTLKAKIRWFLLMVGTLLIISTVYMRYHYLVDVMAGMLMFLFAVWSGKKIERWWNEGIKNV